MAFLRKANDMTLIADEPIHTAEPAAKTPTPVHNVRAANAESAGPLLPTEIVDDLRKRWEEIQAGFVDEPRDAVKQADELVASSIKKLSESFTEARNKLEGQWTRGDANTDDLRAAFKKYRAFFQKLMGV